VDKDIRSNKSIKTHAQNVDLALGWVGVAGGIVVNAGKARPGPGNPDRELQRCVRWVKPAATPPIETPANSRRDNAFMMQNPTILLCG
jgi:hypothetical protein